MRKRLATLTAAAALAAGLGAAGLGSATAAHALPKAGTGVKVPVDRVISDPPPVDPGDGNPGGTTVIVDCYDPVEHHLAPCPTGHDEPDGDGHDWPEHDDPPVDHGHHATRAPSVVVTPTFTG